MALVAEMPPLVEDRHGVLRVRGTRVTLDLVVGEYEDGASPEQIVEAYSTLSLGDVYGVIAYYLHHRDEVERYLERRRRLAEDVQREAEERFPRDGVKERLLARRREAA